MLLLLVLVLSGFASCIADSQSCQIDGVEDERWGNGYHIKVPIEESKDDILKILKTKNVAGVEVIDDRNLLKADYADDAISIRLQGKLDSPLADENIILRMACADNKAKEIDIFLSSEIFDHAWYSFTYNANEGTLTPQNPITVAKNIKLEDIQITAYKDYLELKMEEDKNRLELALKPDMTFPEEAFKDNILLLEISVNNFAEKAILVIRKSAPSRIFNKTVHFAKYNPGTEFKTHPIEMNSDIEKPTVTLKNFNDYFDITSEDSGIKLTKNGALLPEDLFNPELAIIIQASSHSFETPDVAVLIISLDKPSPVFRKKQYTAKYTTTSDLILDEPIIIDGLQNDTIVKLSDDSKYFEVQVIRTEVATINLVVLEHPLPKEILNKGHILLEIRATNPNQDKHGFATVYIEMSNDMVHPPVFGKHLYFGFYEPKTGVSLNEKIIVVRGLQENTRFAIKSEFPFFNLEMADNNTGEILLTASKNVPDDLLGQKDQIVIEIEAVNPELTIPGRTAVILRTKGNTGSEECNIWYYSSENGFSVLLGIAIIITLVLVLYNAIMMAAHFRKQRMQARSNVPMWVKPPPTN